MSSLLDTPRLSRAGLALHVYFEAGTYSVAQAGLEFVSLLPQPPK